MFSYLIPSTFGFTVAFCTSSFAVTTTNTFESFSTTSTFTAFSTATSALTSILLSSALIKLSTLLAKVVTDNPAINPAVIKFLIVLFFVVFMFFLLDRSLVVCICLVYFNKLELLFYF